MNEILASLIRTQAARDARTVRPGHSLPALLSFTCPQHPAQEIRTAYQEHLTQAQLGLALLTLAAVHAHEEAWP